MPNPIAAWGHCYFWRTTFLRCPANAVVALGGLQFCGAHAQHIANETDGEVRKLLGWVERRR